NADKLVMRAHKKLDKIENFIEKGMRKPIPKKQRGERIYPTEAEALLNMVDMLKSLVQ
ncbi:MAG: hypothetical protein UY70_C0034G0005, partial [Candidatus Kaiserbacteria bacterium GW2011_GWB1_52_6]